MTVASYISDLADIFMFESTTGVSAYGSGGAGLGAGADYAMEGTNAVDKQITAAEKGLMYDNGTNFIIGADTHFIVWINGATPGICDTRDNRGIVACMGDSTSAFVKFHVNGKDTLPFGGGKPYVLRFNNSALINRRTLVGSPGATPSWIGGGLNTTGSVKGANLGVDAARQGTGYDITGGTNPDSAATFAGIAADDESTSEGLFQNAPGGFNWQGKIRLGSAGSTGELTDSNTNLYILDTIHSLADFTEMLIENAGSILTLTNVNFIALGTNNKGRLEVLTSTATLTLAGTGFIGFGNTILGTGSTLTNCRWLAAESITLNGGALVSPTINNCPDAVSVFLDNLNLITDGSFESDGSNHANELSSIGGGSMTWNSVATGYDAGATGSPVTPTNTGNETIYVNVPSGTITINVASGASIPSIRSAGAIVNVVAGQVPITVTVKDKDTGSPIEFAHVLILKDSDKSELLNAATNASGVATTNITYTSNFDLTGWARQMDVVDIDYHPEDITGVLTSSGFLITVSLRPIT